MIPNRFENFPEGRRVGFFCWSNVGRSQAAQGFWLKLADNHGVETSAISAGFYRDRIPYLRRKYHGHPHPEVTRRMKQNYGIDISQQRIKPATPKMLEELDAIVIFCREGQIPPFINDFRGKVIMAPIRDPASGDQRGIAHVKRLEINDTLEQIYITVLNVWRGAFGIF